MAVAQDVEKTASVSVSKRSAVSDGQLERDRLRLMMLIRRFEEQTFRILRYFTVTHNGWLYRIYVTAIDLLCVRIGRSQIPQQGSAGGAVVAGGLLGGAVGAGIAGAAAHRNNEAALAEFERDVAVESEMLMKRDENGIRAYIKALKRGFDLDPTTWRRLKSATSANGSGSFSAGPIRPSSFAIRKKARSNSCSARRAMS